VVLTIINRLYYLLRRQQSRTQATFHALSKYAWFLIRC